MDHFERSCVCCFSNRITIENTVISPFFALRAWGGKPEPTKMATCTTCGFRCYHRILSDKEVRSYYDGYRNEQYYQQRHTFEPFYTRSLHQDLNRWLACDARRKDLSDALIQVGLDEPLAAVLDYGGGHGSLLHDIHANRKAVFDLSGEAVKPGIELLVDPTSLGSNWTLVTCAQVLEHVSNPRNVLRDIANCLHEDAHVYLEVPNQTWRSWPALQPPHGLLKRLCRHPYLLLAADIYSTLFRVKLKVLPPFGFVPMREHINFFTLQALVSLAKQCGLKVCSQGSNSQGSFFVIAQKRQDH